MNWAFQTVMMLCLFYSLSACASSRQAKASDTEAVRFDHRRPMTIGQVTTATTAAELLVDLLDLDEYMDRQATLALYRDQPGYVVDLDGDGRDEYICEPTWFIDPQGQKCSIGGVTANGPSWVLAKRNGRWVEIGQVDGKAARVLGSLTNGWRDIENDVDGNGHNYPYLYQYRNGRYHGRLIGDDRQTSH